MSLYTDHRITEYPELEGTRKDHWVQPRLHTAAPKPNPVSQSGAPMLHELWHSGPCLLPWAARSMPTALWDTAFPSPPAALAWQLCTIPLGPVIAPLLLWGAAAAMSPTLSPTNSGPSATPHAPSPLDPFSDDPLPHQAHFQGKEANYCENLSALGKLLAVKSWVASRAHLELWQTTNQVKLFPSFFP